MLHRRQFLSFAGAAGALLAAPSIAFAAVESERRFVFIIQRGACDGLETLIPLGDPGYAALRGSLAIDPATAIKLDGTFALHPAYQELGSLYRSGQALFVHAIASPYRERSHFDGQNVLESGASRPYQLHDGWMNRLTAMLPKTRDEAIAFAPTVPLALRGGVPVPSYAPAALPVPPDDLLVRLAQLYDRTDPQLHQLWSEAVEAREIGGDVSKRDPASLGKLAASFLAKPDGPRIAMIETGGWDTHAGQAKRLARQHAALDQILAALRSELGPVWNDTVVLIATEFGRTAAANGTGGTDHGTAAVAMLAGGAVRGGRIIADWPGLGPRSLYEGRDLMPTASLDALIAGVAGETLGIDPARTGATLFASPVKPMTGLVRS